MRGPSKGIREVAGWSELAKMPGMARHEGLFGDARRVEDGDQEENAETLSGQPDAKSGVLEPGLAVDVGLGVVSTRLVFKAM